MRFPLAILACRAALPLVVVYSARFPSKALIDQKASNAKVTFIDAQEIAGQIWTKIEIEGARIVQGTSIVRSKIHCLHHDGSETEGIEQVALFEGHAPYASVPVESMHRIEGASACRYDVSIPGLATKSFCLDKEDDDSSFRLLKTCL